MYWIYFTKQDGYVTWDYYSQTILERMGHFLVELHTFSIRILIKEGTNLFFALLYYKFRW